ncbi:hypothetical protein [Acidimangrovimonas pyrenivorans]|uniref:Uncharacterized protein n=1 Tax=Acidimangrovimonas pyrenivorans TaxID=2030798 RepID=A0ABV7AH92_9RHOB
MTRAPKPETDRREDDLAVPEGPALQLLLDEMTALSRILPPRDVPGADADEDEVEAVFDNMPV